MKPESAGRSRPTMRQVAALAKVSIKTVSRVVNREPGVSPRLAKRVLAATERLSYRHNLTASSSAAAASAFAIPRRSRRTIPSSTSIRCSASSSRYPL